MNSSKVETEKCWITIPLTVFSSLRVDGREEISGSRDASLPPGLTAGRPWARLVTLLDGSILMCEQQRPGEQNIKSKWKSSMDQNVLYEMNVVLWDLPSVFSLPSAVIGVESLQLIL